MHRRSWGRAALVAAATGAITVLLYLISPIGATAGIAIIGSTITALTLIRCWLGRLEQCLTDTAAERRHLAERTAQSRVSHLANITARNEIRLAAAESEARNEQRLQDAIAAMRDEFENARAEEIVKAYERGAINERNGVHKAWATAPTGDLIFLADRRQTPTSPMLSPARQPGP